VNMDVYLSSGKEATTEGGLRGGKIGERRARENRMPRGCCRRRGKKLVKGVSDRGDLPC